MTLVPAALPEVAATAALTAAFVAAPILLRSRRLLTGLRAERDAAVQETARIGARCGALKEETQHLVAVAELLANAVHHSHGTLSVDVSLHQAESGACIVIDDAGVGMHQDEVEFATRLLSGRHSVQLTELGDPLRAGFATIGRLVRQYGFAVSVDKPAPYGGVRAVVSIPGHLLTRLDEQIQPMSATSPLPRHTSPPSAVENSAATPDALPQRRRRQPQPAHRARSAVAEQAPPTPEETQAAWSAFQAGTGSGRAAAHPHRREGNTR